VGFIHQSLRELALDTRQADVEKSTKKVAVVRRFKSTSALMATAGSAIFLL
jgi:hypothetical protein